MSSPGEILKKIQDTLFARHRVGAQDFTDVPFVDDEEYTTHQRLGEQEKEEDEKKKNLVSPEPVPPEEVGEVPEEEPEETPEVAPTAGGQVPPAAGGEMGPEGMPGEELGMGAAEEEPKTASEIGRIFELKKIYSRLVSIESHLEDSSDIILLKLRDYVSRAIDLFETLASNLDSFKEELDNIIVLFYKFLEIVYVLLKKYYKIKRKEDEEEF